MLSKLASARLRARHPLSFSELMYIILRSGLNLLRSEKELHIPSPTKTASVHSTWTEQDWLWRNHRTSLTIHERYRLGPRETRCTASSSNCGILVVFKDPRMVSLWADHTQLSYSTRARECMPAHSRLSPTLELTSAHSPFYILNLFSHYFKTEFRTRERGKEKNSKNCLLHVEEKFTRVYLH